MHDVDFIVFLICSKWWWT